MHHSKFKPMSSVCAVASMLMYDNELPFTELPRQDKWKRIGRNWTHVIWRKSNLHQTSVSVTLKSTFSQKHFFFFLFLGGECLSSAAQNDEWLESCVHIHCVTSPGARWKSDFKRQEYERDWRKGRSLGCKSVTQVRHAFFFFFTCAWKH